MDRKQFLIAGPMAVLGTMIGTLLPKSKKVVEHITVTGDHAVVSHNSVEHIGVDGHSTQLVGNVVTFTGEKYSAGVHMTTTSPPPVILYGPKGEKLFLGRRRG